MDFPSAASLFINKAKEKEVTEKYVKELATKTPTTDQLVVNLSGGNQQKVVIAKWLTRDSDILIFDEPTRGIDVGAKNEIYKLMKRPFVKFSIVASVVFSVTDFFTTTPYLLLSSDR